MKLFLSAACMAAFLLAAPVKAQTTNYALRFTTEGLVSLGQFDELDGASQYTLQFFFKANTWTEGAKILSRGNSMSISLGATAGQLNIVTPGASGTLNLGTMQTGVWKQVTLIYDNGTLTARVNNAATATTLSGDYAWTATDEPLILGGDFDGSIDELRIWKTALSATNADGMHLWQNTVNAYHPQIENLAAYYKFDQNQCEHVVDYCMKHHGTFSATGVTREAVTDNSNFVYRITAAYTDFNRFADRAIDREKYLLANHLIIIGINTYSDGTADISYPCNQGTPTGTTYLDAFDGRTGVLQFNGSGSGMELPATTFDVTDEYCFATWLYIDEWQEGAYLFRKEKNDSTGFSIRLGSEADKAVTVRVNGQEYTRTGKLDTGKWIHLGVTTNQSSYKSQQIMFTIDGEGCFALRGYYPTTDVVLTQSGMSTTKAYIGENFKGKLDNTIMFKRAYDASGMQTLMKNPPMPAFGKIVDASTLKLTDSYYEYDLSNDPGHDSYSYKHYVGIMRSAYDGHRGAKVIVSAAGHTGWETTFANATTRTKLAKAIAQIVNENDCFDGVDLDFEWTYTDTGWSNYAKLVKTLRENLDAGKTLSVTPHKVSYRFPTAYMQYVDMFLFQIYGPNDKSIFLQSGFTEAYNAFVNWGYPADKIVMSYATTTSAGFNASDALIKNGTSNAYPPTGIRNLIDDSYTPSLNKLYDATNSCYRYFTGYDQVQWRTQQMVSKGCAGIFYWDMGNDVATSNQYSFPRASNFIISSNVDTLVTVVDNAPAAPTGIGHIIGGDATHTLALTFNNNTGYVEAAGVGALRVSIYDVQGRLLKQSAGAEGQCRVSASALTTGVYLAVASDAKGNKKTIRFTKP